MVLFNVFSYTGLQQGFPANLTQSGLAFLFMCSTAMSQFFGPGWKCEAAVLAQTVLVLGMCVKVADEAVVGTELGMIAKVAKEFI